MAPFKVTTINIKDDGTGLLTAEVQNLAEFKSLIAHLDPVGILADPEARARYIGLRKEPMPPTSFPSSVGLHVKEVTPDDGVKELMWFGNNFLQDGAAAWVVEFVPPEEGGPSGILRLLIADAEEYDTVGVFLHEQHGSVLRPYGGDMAYVFSTSDDGEPEGQFPQVVTYVVEHRYLL